MKPHSRLYVGIGVGPKTRLFSEAASHMESNPQIFEEFVELTGMSLKDYLARQRRSGTYSDHFGLQAFCDLSGFGVRVHSVEMAAHRTLTLRPALPGSDVLEFLDLYHQPGRGDHCEETHYDALLHGKKRGAEEGLQEGAIRAKEGSPAKKPKLAKPAKGEDMGYDLSRVRPKRSVPKSKVAVDETYVEATSKQDFITRCTNSRVSGGKRSTVCGERTAEMHWRQIRMYLGWIQAPQGAHIRDHLNIKDLTKALKHMETQPTIRKSPFKPGSVQLLSRSLSVAIQVFLVDRPLQDRFGLTLNFEPSRAWHKVGPDSILLKPSSFGRPCRPRKRRSSGDAR